MRKALLGNILLAAYLKFVRQLGLLDQPMVSTIADRSQYKEPRFVVLQAFFWSGRCLGSI